MPAAALLEPTAPAAPRMGALPDFLIVGAQKSGTSSLYGMLTRHPQMRPAMEKEVHYFDVQQQRGEAWYRAQFPAAVPGTVTGEASPYYLFHPHAARRAAALVPRAKLIVMLRNPIERAYSHYQHMRRDGLEHLTFEEAVSLEADRVAPEHDRLLKDESAVSDTHRNHSYLLRGMYAYQIAEWLRYFSASHIFVILAEEFFAEPAGVYRQVLRFLGLRDEAPRDTRALNTGSYSPVAPETRAVLKELFEPHNQRLARMLGRDPGWT